MLSSQKNHFSLPENLHYLNCAYKAPLLKSAEIAALKALLQARNPSQFSSVNFFTEAEAVKGEFGKLVNCQADEVAFIPSVSYGMSNVLNNIVPEAGKHALTIENEFPSSVFSLQRWCETHRLELKVIGPDEELELAGKDWNEKILEAIKPQTSLVMMSSVHWMNGLKFDLEKIGARCKEVGALFILDGTQSVGAIPIDVKAIQADALICAAYKWLMGPYSLGAAYFGEAFHKGIPIEESWMNRANAEDFANLTDYDPIYRPKAARYSVGESSNFILMPMFHAALKQLNHWQPSRILTYCKELIHPLLSYLTAVGVEMEEDAYFSPHLFGLRLPAGIKQEEFKQRLARNNIAVSVRGSSLRVSLNVYNTSEDILALMQTIEEAKQDHASHAII